MKTDTFTVANGIEVQQRQLAEWKLLLKPKAFNLLKKEVEKTNNTVTSGYNVCRGVEMDNILFNKVLKFLR